ncbi:MAG: hypothetical protein KAW67_05530, partial [Candidatus Eisenbacteria sp.]|nr:hypothetical protein [Candidatus Eisenbacteria bacterium]
SFCTVINCMDGRVQLPVIRYLQERFEVLYVDSITEAGPVRSLAEPADETVSQAILSRVAVSTEKQGSKVVAVVAHDDCARNPEDETTQRRQLEEAVDFIAGRFPEAVVLGLWLSTDWSVCEVTSRDPAGGA